MTTFPSGDFRLAALLGGTTPVPDLFRPIRMFPVSPSYAAERIICEKSPSKIYNEIT